MNLTLILLIIVSLVLAYSTYKNYRLRLDNEVLLDEIETEESSKNHYIKKYNQAILMIDKLNLEKSSMMVTMMKNNSSVVTDSGLKVGGSNDFIH